VEPHSQIPTNAVYATTGIALLVTLLLFGPSTVLNGVFGAGAVCFFFSYGMPIWLNVATWGRQLPKDRYFNMGKLSMPISIVAICWQLISVVFLCFPLYQPVTTNNMNWASAAAVVGLAVFMVNWFVYANHHYHAPKPLYVEVLHGDANKTA
jgi:choline transport protein